MEFGEVGKRGGAERSKRGSRNGGTEAGSGGAGARVGEGRGRRGGRGDQARGTPQRRAPTPLPAGLWLGRPAQDCAAGAGVPSTRPTATPSGGGARVREGGARPPQRRNNNEPFRPGGVNLRGPPPRGETGLPRLPPLPAPSVASGGLPGQR